MNQRTSIPTPPTTRRRATRAVAVGLAGLVVCGGLLVGCSSGGSSNKSGTTDSTEAVTKGRPKNGNVSTAN